MATDYQPTQQEPAPPMPGEPFDPAKYLITISGKKYLEVKWRLVWLRSDQPDAVIETEMVKEDGKFALFRAKVSIPGGGSSTGWGAETMEDFGDYIEKAETKSLGRALAGLGYGTQFCEDHNFGGDQGHVVDSPSERVGGRPTVLPAPRRPATNDPATERQISAIYAIGRAMKLDRDQVDQHSIDLYGVPPDRLDRRSASALIDSLKSWAVVT